jgi:4-amino-4-deoxy-L-arabinose transferase-like glycosyltransferase
VTQFLNHRGTCWSVVGLAVVLFAITNLPWHLDDYDQAKQAFTSFEMAKQGHWIFQHTPNGWVATKPPLVGWFSAAIYLATRSWELAWRLPSFLAALGLLGLIARAASVYGRVPALIAVCAFAFNLFTPRLATLVRTDMPLALILFLIGWLIWEKIQTRETWSAKDRLVLFLLLSASMLIKGPIVFAFLLPGIFVFQWRARVRGEALTVWCGWWPWLASLGIFLIWTIRGVFIVPEFFEHVVMREFAGRFSETMHRSQPIYFYLPHLLHRFAPWSIFLILLPALAAREQKLKIRDWLRAMSPETFWLVAWSLGGLLVMSFVPSKRIDRVFPVVPPLCLLLAAVVAGLQKRERLRAVTAGCCAIVIVIACLFTTAYAGRKIVFGHQQHTDAFATFGKAVLQETAARHWRFAVVGGEDEGLLLYLRQTEFLEPDQAVAAWKSGMLDALVVPDDELTELLPRLDGAVPSQLEMSGPAGNYRKRYILLLRS